MMAGKKNLKIELMRFYCTIVVCLHHFKMYSEDLPYGGGYIVVDFFFIISGYFLLRHIKSENRESKKWSKIGNYAVKRYIRLLPPYLLAFLTALLIRRIFLGDIFEGAIGGYVREALMIEMFYNASGQRVNPPDWYCGCLILSSILLYIVFEFGKHRLKNSYLLLISALCYGILFFRRGNINIFPQTAGVFSIAYLRAFAGMTVGCFIYNFMNAQNRRFGEKWDKTVGGVLFIVISYMVLWDNAYRFTDYVVILLFILLFCLCVNKEWESNSRLLNRVIMFLGALSYTLYLNHYTVARVFSKKQYLITYDWKWASLIYLVSTVLFSVLLFLIEKGIKRGIMVLIKRKKR